MADSTRSRQNCAVDLGEEEFTVGRLHPMIDNGLRIRRLLHGRLAVLPGLDDLGPNNLLGSGDSLDLSRQLPDPGSEIPQARLEVGQERPGHRFPRAPAEIQCQGNKAQENQDAQESQELTLRHCSFR
jgi:hypothetical protein